MSKQLRIWLFVLLGTLLASSSLLAEGVISMTTSKAVGETIKLTIEANGNVTIEGIKETPQTGSERYYTLTSQTVTIRGDVTELECSENQLTSLAVSKNTALTGLGCSFNQLTSLDVSQNTALTSLYCDRNQLTSLDVSGCTSLTKLDCSDNLLTSLDVSGCTALAELDCSDPHFRYSKRPGTLTNLNVSDCTALTKLDCRWNQLTSLDVSDCTALTSLYCNENYLTSLNVSGCTALTDLSCYENQLTSLDVSSCTSLTTLECYWNQLTSLNVSGCTSLTSLSCYENQLTSLDVSGCSALTKLRCSYNQLTSLDVSGCTALELLECSWSQLTSLDVSSCTALTSLYCDTNQLTSLDVSSCTSLTTLHCWQNQLTSLNVSGCSALTTLQCNGNKLTSLDLSNNSALTGLGCSFNQLTSLDVSGCSALTELECGSNQLTSLNASSCTSLTALECGSNQLTSLDVSGCTALTALSCYKNQLTSLDVSGCTALTELNCQDNQLTSLDVSGCTALISLACSNNQLTSLDVSGCTALIGLKCSNNQLTSLDLSTCPQLDYLDCSANQIKGVAMTQLVSSLPPYTYNGSEVREKFDGRFIVVSNSAQEGNVCLKADAASAREKNWNLLKKVDEDKFVPYEGESDNPQQPVGSGIIKMTTTRAIGETITLGFKANGGVVIEGAKTPLQPDGYFAYYTLTSQTVIIRGDVTGLDCGSNQLTSLDVSSCTSLTTLDCGSNQLTSLDVSGFTALTKLDCYNSQLTSLDVSGCTALTALHCSNNQLTSLNVSSSAALTSLYCSGNQLTSLDVSGCTALMGLECSINQLTSLDVSKNTALIWLYCSFNQLTSLDLSKNNVLKTLDCSGNQLTSLGLSHNSELRSLLCDYNQIKGAEMTKLVNSLPKMDGEQISNFFVVRKDSFEGNVCLKSDVAIVAEKGWTPLGYNRSTKEWEYYGGRETDSFGVSLTHEGEGSIAARGAGDLSAVPYGTELTITATPAEGYELAALTANGVDILESKSFVVKGYTEVKATFTQKVKYFAVSFTQIGEGYLNATGADDLDAVPYGTELTINATPATGYELTALTANGRDILSTKRFVVKGDTEVKATFTQKVRTYTVTFSKTGERRVTATGADDLDAVPDGTELTVVATPAAGYELTALTANGRDILSTKRFVVKGNTEVKATFTKKVKSFAVMFTQIGEGYLNATGADDLDAVPYGTELTIEATPATGYELTALTANGRDILSTKRFVVKGDTEVKATFTKKARYFAVTFTQTGEGYLNATGADDLDAVPYGTELTVVATPAAGYELTALTANGRDILSTKRFVVKGDTEVKATFTKKVKSFAVTFTQIGEGYLNATGADDLDAVSYGTELTITATPATGYELTALTANGRDILSTKRFVVKGDTEVKATFTEKASNYTVTFSKTGEGRVTATGADDLSAVPYGTELTVVATPAAGYELTALTANGRDILATKKLVVKANTTIEATFTKKTFAVTLTQEGKGVLKATGAKDLKAVPSGTKLTIIATPAEGYELTALLANGFDILQSKSVVVTEETNIKAVFRKKTFAVTLTSNEHGEISIVEGVDPKRIPYGTELTITATPADGYELTVLTANGRDILSTKRFVVKGDTEVKATFAQKTLAVTLTHEGEGKVDATGADNLNAVPYGTELTIVAQPKQGYELTALTANGRDILATRKVVVTEDLTVKATFAQKTFAVTLTQEGEGVLNATGADDLKAVPYGTKLTITATPATGYELAALMANGLDILSTKSVEVTGDTRIKAIFRKKTFAVTLTSNEHGTISIVEPVDLDVVAYGTTLTVKATGKNAQCVLTALTANGEDILATKSFVVKGATEVKATFVDHTGVETTVTQQLKLYPNPATDYVIVEGVAPASEVTLHSMTGERLYADRADSRGTLRIDLTPYADGVYLVCVAGETYRVVVRR